MCRTILIWLSGIFLAMSIGRADESPIDHLHIDKESVPLSLIEAYGRSKFNYLEYCPPVSDTFIQDRFVSDYLIATQAKSSDASQRETELAKALEPLQQKLDKLNRILKAQKDIDISTVYQKQVSRLESEIVVLRTKILKDHERSAESRLRRDQRIKRLDNVAQTDKQFLANMNYFSSLYSRQLKDGISDQMVQVRYNEMVREKHDRVTNVYYFQNRVAFVGANDKETIAGITEYLKDKSTIQRMTGDKSSLPDGGSNMRYPSNMLITAHTLNGGTHWVRYNEFFDTFKKTPETIDIGTTLVSKSVKLLTADDHDVFHVMYIFDKVFYPVVDLNAKTPDRQHASNFIRNELFENLYATQVSALRADAVVTRNDEPILESTNYQACPSR